MAKTVKYRYEATEYAELVPVWINDYVKNGDGSVFPKPIAISKNPIVLRAKKKDNPLSRELVARPATSDELEKYFISDRTPIADENVRFGGRIKRIEIE